MAFSISTFVAAIYPVVVGALVCSFVDIEDGQCPELPRTSGVCDVSLDSLIVDVGSDIEGYFTQGLHFIHDGTLRLGAPARVGSLEGIYPGGHKGAFVVGDVYVLAASRKSLRALYVDGDKGSAVTGWITVLLAVSYQRGDTVGWGYLSLSDAVTEPNTLRWRLVGRESVMWLLGEPTIESLDHFIGDQYSLESSIVPTPMMEVYTVQDSTEPYLYFDSVTVCSDMLQKTVGGVPEQLRQ